MLLGVTAEVLLHQEALQTSSHAYPKLLPPPFPPLSLSLLPPPPPPHTTTATNPVPFGVLPVSAQETQSVTGGMWCLTGDSNNVQGEVWWSRLSQLQPLWRYSRVLTCWHDC